ncbi:hypothetical protein STAS_12616 [Striga asiatica]|uniref:Uncharacterized protein n=1 Tax=Striga asiatica TaxID=4170 RepID=A0A5A7PTY8_STRAF|nr:hypothetical protein STAS_12616 [Striga asiatica]
MEILDLVLADEKTRVEKTKERGLRACLCLKGEELGLGFSTSDSKNKKYISNSKIMLKSEIDELENGDVVLLYETDEKSNFLILLQRVDHNNGLDASMEDEVTIPLKIV